jgi:alanyl-tRNA synthetase
MNSQEIRDKYRSFIQKEGHKFLPSVSILPENDPSTIFISSGVQTMVPYVMGQDHPQGDKVANIQKCIRMQDIDEVGDATHDTFFEMIGYWSFGDYFKEKSIQQLYDFFTKEMGLDPEKLYVTCFEGDDNAPKDTESAEIWQKIGIPEERIYFMGADDNWWSVGDNGPCGPDTEVFYDVSGENLNLKSKEEFLTADSEQKIVEIANSVFMQYKKEDGKVVGNLEQNNVDMGSGFERVVMTVQEKDNIFDTDLFADLMTEISKKTNGVNLKSQRIIADHIRTSVFMISDGVFPSNTEAGYVLRRLIRRAVRLLNKFEYSGAIGDFVDVAIKPYSDTYKELSEDKGKIVETLNAESEKFQKTLEAGIRELRKSIDKNARSIDGKVMFQLFSTYGFPIELSLEEIENISGRPLPEGVKENFVDIFKKELTDHQEKSRQGADKKFKGGLSGTGDMEVKYHTATHLLHQALRDVLGEHVQQKGSNITAERLRFDFSHDEKMTDEQKQEVEKIVNEKIKEALPVNVETMSFDEAEKTGALHFFGDKYGDEVTVYYIGNSIENAYSKEFCGGPHVKNTSDLVSEQGKFKIKKEEASSAGVRRIKAVLE